MVRLGVLEAQGEAILKSPKPNSAYFARSDEDLQAWSEHITAAFRRGPNAIYNLVLNIFRSEVANHLQGAGQFPSRAPLVVPTCASTVTGKRRLDVIEISESEDEQPPRCRRR